MSSICADFGGVTAKGEPCRRRAADGLCPAHRENATPGGRPTKYEERYTAEVYKLCLLGATNEFLADFFNVHIDTIHEWARQHPEFSDARKRGKAQADALVAESLFHRALGYEHDAVKILQHEGESYEHEYRKKYPPDTTAAIFWLKNRQPESWRDRKSHEVSGLDGEPIEHVHLYVPDNGRDAKVHANGNGAHPNGDGRPKSRISV